MVPVEWVVSLVMTGEGDSSGGKGKSTKLSGDKGEQGLF